MIEGSGGELQQLVQEDESEEPLTGNGDTTTPVTPPRAPRRSKNDMHNVHSSVSFLLQIYLFFVSRL